jgi:hypothetical protein
MQCTVQEGIEREELRESLSLVVVVVVVVDWRWCFCVERRAAAVYQLPEAFFERI